MSGSNPSDNTEQSDKWPVSQLGMLSETPSETDWISNRTFVPSSDADLTLGKIPIQNLSISSIPTMKTDSGSGLPSVTPSNSRVFEPCRSNAEFDKLFNTFGMASSFCVEKAFDKAIGNAKCGASQPKIDNKAEFEEKDFICKAAIGEVCPRFGVGKLVKNVDKLKYKLTEEELFYAYLDQHKIEKILQTMLTLVCLEKPDDPYAYMQEYLSLMVSARSNQDDFQRIPRIYTEEHVAAIFRLMDKSQNKFISNDQYITAMEQIFGLDVYSKTPDGFRLNQIPLESFVKEAKQALDLSLWSTLQTEFKDSPKQSKKMKVKKH